MFIDNGIIEASYSNFGYIPYGQTIMGIIHYDPINATGCKEYDKNEELHFHRYNDVTPFMVAMRGECSFVQKARNMENIGVAVSIVVDDQAETI